MASKLFKKNKNSTTIQKNEEEKELKSKIPTPKPLKKNSQNLSSSSLYASSPALSLQQPQEELSKPSSVSTSRLKSVRNFFRNKFNFNNKTANKRPIISSPLVALSNNNIETTTISMIVLDTDEKLIQDQVNSKCRSNLKENFIKSKYNENISYFDAHPVSEDEGISSKTPDSLKNYQDNKKLNNENKNNSFGYSSESFASLGSIDSALNTNTSPEQIIISNDNLLITDNSMNKAKIKAASYRNMRKTTTNNKKRLLTGNNEIDSGNTTDIESGNNSNSNLISSFMMDPIEEISSKKEEEIIIEEDNDEKENFKKMLQQQLKSHLNEPTKIYLNKTNTQLEDKQQEIKTQQIPLLLPQTSNELLEKLKNNLKSTNRTNKQQIESPQQEQKNEFDMVKLKSASNNTRSNSIDLENDEPIYDNISSSSSNLLNNNDKKKSIESSDEDLIEQSTSNRNLILRKRTPSDAPKNSSRKTTIITSSNDIDTDNNICKLGHSKSMKYVDSVKINLKSPSTNDLNKQQLSSKILLTTTTKEPPWREMALKKQSAWNNNSVENLLNNRSSNHQNEEKSESNNKFGKVKSLIKDLEK